MYAKMCDSIGVAGDVIVGSPGVGIRTLESLT